MAALATSTYDVECPECGGTITFNIEVDGTMDSRQSTPGFATISLKPRIIDGQKTIAAHRDLHAEPLG